MQYLNSIEKLMQACISDNLICQYSIVTHMMKRSDYDKIGHIYHFINPVLDMDIIIIQQYHQINYFYWNT